MPSKSLPDVEKTILLLEDNTLSYLMRSEHYRNLDCLMSCKTKVPSELLELLLNIFVRDLKEDTKYSVLIFKSLKHILNKIKEGEYEVSKKLMETSHSVLYILRTTTTLHKVITLQTMCLEILLLFPTTILQELVTKYQEEVVETIEKLLNKGDPGVKKMVLEFILHILKCLGDEKMQFIKDSLSLWFTCLVPQMFIYNSVKELSIQVMEYIIDDLVTLDYSKHPSWINVMKNITTQDRYPAQMKSMLENGDENWHRVWTLLIKLLGTLLHKSGGPINSLLVVLETAFKLEPQNRMKAFYCWRALIQNFALNTDELFIVKRVKLLSIPLKVNNAKIEEIAVCKFDVWWYLMNLLQPRVHTHFEFIYLPFLHFCFGNPKLENSLVPGLAFPKMNFLAIEALTELFGHFECSGCTRADVQLSKPILDLKLLVKYWEDWLHSLKESIQLVCRVESNKSLLRNMLCIWKSFVKQSFLVPDAGKKEAIIRDVIKMLISVAEKCEEKVKLCDLMLNTIVPNLLNIAGNETMLFKKMSLDDKGVVNITPVKLLVRMLLTGMHTDSIENIEGQKQILSKVVSNKDESFIKWFLNELPLNNFSSLWWCSLACTIIENDKVNISNELMKDIILWPITKMEIIENVDMLKEQWKHLYNHIKSSNTSLDMSISNIFLLHYGDNNKAETFALNVLPSILCNISRHQPEKFKEMDKDFTTVLDLLTKQKTNISESDFKHLISSFGIILDSFDIINGDCKKIVQTILKIINNLLVQSSLLENVVSIENELESLLESLQRFITKESNIKSKSHFIEGLTKIGVCETLPKVRLASLNILKSIMKQTSKAEIQVFATLSKTIERIEDFEKNDNQSILKEASVIVEDIVEKVLQKDEKFFSPKNKKSPTSKIVKTVMDGNEEVVVIKSNWKFNPSKLTEHQKDVLKKKREDIPALYQDLSQSQDDSNIQAWKTPGYKSDSQDTSLSKGNSSDTVTTCKNILKDIPNPEKIPNIIKQLTEDTELQNSPEIVKIPKEITKPKTPKVVSTEVNIKCKENTPNELSEIQTSSPQSRRLSLKEKINRNVQNLLESSGKKHIINKNSDEVCQTNAYTKLQNEVNTPEPQKQAIQNANYSAPVDLERPSRIKRKPKKFDPDDEEVNVKRRRNSHGGVNVQIRERGSCVEIVSTDENQKQDIETLVDTKTSDESVLSSVKSGFPINNSIDEFKNAKENEVKIKSISTPNQAKEKKDVKTKGSTKRKSKLEKELEINTVEGHPLLTPISKTRATRNSKAGDNETPKRRLNSERNRDRVNSPTPKKTSPKVKRFNIKLKEEEKLAEVKNVQEKSDAEKEEKTRSDITKANPVKEVSTNNNEKSVDPPSKTSSSCSESMFSEDIIESSQDSSASSTFSIKSLKKSVNKSFETASKDTIDLTDDNDIQIFDTVSQKPESEIATDKTTNNETIDYSKMGENSIAEMNTQPTNNTTYSDVILIENDDSNQIRIDLDTQIVDKNSTMSEEIAQADTQPMEQDTTTKLNIDEEDRTQTDLTANNETEKMDETLTNKTSEQDTLQHSCRSTLDSSLITSPSKENEEQNREDFLNNTMDISPIKTINPDPEVEQPTRVEEFTVVQLSPLNESNDDSDKKDECSSPEMFTNDKMNESPPRTENSKTSSSPSSSLSLKKNRPQVRQMGRGAQMLGLCMPDKLQTMKVNENNSESDQQKASAKRNLRMLYHNTNNEENDSGNEGDEVFLKFKKAIPPADSSPSCPILKRKYADIADDTLMSPVSKKKRVSFHDPPVSTTVSVYKYIEETGIRSPSSRIKDRQNRSPIAKSLIKKLENEYNKDSEENDCSSEPNTLDSMPSIDVVRHDELNDVDPIFEKLIDCSDPITNIATELSSPMMKDLLIKEWRGTINTIGDIAKLTEREINRLSIKAPKIETVLRVLTNYHNSYKATCSLSIDEPSNDVLGLPNVSEPCELVSHYFEPSVKTDSAEPVLSDFKLIKCDAAIQADILLNKSIEVILSRFNTNDILSVCSKKPDFLDSVKSCTSQEQLYEITKGLQKNLIISNLQEKLSGNKELLKETIKMLYGFYCESFLNEIANLDGINHKFCEKIGVDNIEKYLILKLSPGELVQYCCNMMQRKIPFDGS